MNSIGNNIVEYPDFDMNNDSQKIGIFVVKNRGEYQSPTYIRLLSTFNKLESNFSSCLIDVRNEEIVSLVESDLLNDNFLLDIVIISRDAFYSNDFAELLIKKCKLLGIKIIYELDDDLMNIDKSHRDYNYYVKKRPGIFFIVKNADVVTVSTNTLKSKLYNYNSNIIVIPNVMTHYWEVDVEKINNSNPNTIKIGYMGTPTHRDDIKLIEDAIFQVKQYFDKLGKTVIFEMIGGTAENLSWASQINISEENKVFPNFVKFLKKIVDWDIALAPLEDNNINSSKSELKYIEYSCLGVPGIYSNIGPYKENIVHEYNGLLVKHNTSIEWAENIIKLAENEQLRNSIKNVSKEDINSNYSLDISISMWLEILNECMRDKNSLLYTNFKKYVDNNYVDSFYEYLIEESYNIILDSKLFDEKYYLSKYPEVGFLDMDPIDHYLKLGIDEDCKPSPNFNLEKHLVKFPNIKFTKLLPFVHYVLYDGISRSPLVLFNDTIYSSDYDDNFNILNNSNSFDEKYYLDHYQDVARSNMSAVEHWIKHGFKSKEPFRNPNSYFSKLYYAHKYLINGEGFWNSLTHYEVLGKKRGYKQNIFDMVYKNFSDIQIKNISTALSNKISIIFPIINIFPELKSNIFSLINSIDLDFEIIFLVDKSLINEFEEIVENYNIDHTCMYFDDFNNFFETLQSVLYNLDNDVVILNSYIKLTEKWLNKLIIKAYSDENICMVSPISNLFEGLDLHDINRFKDSYMFSIEEINKLIQKSSDGVNINLDYWDGSCIFIKNNAIKCIDFKNIDIVYNDSNNLIFGLELYSDKLHVLDDSTYVYVDKNFFRDSNELFSKHIGSGSLLSLKINRFMNSFEVRDIGNNLKDAIKYISFDTLSSRSLYFVDEQNVSSIEEYLMKNSFGTQDSFFLTFNSNAIKLCKRNFVLKKWNISNIKYDSTGFKSILFNILVSLNIDSFNILDFSEILFELNKVIKTLGIDLIIHCVDYYPFCPLWESNDYCNNECNGSFICPNEYLKDYKEDRIRQLACLFNEAQLIIIDEFFNENYCETFPSINQKKIISVGGYIRKLK